MNTLFNQPLNVVNAGLSSFADNLALAGGDVTHLQWQPPALGNVDAGLALASLIRHPLVEHANGQAFQQYLAAQPVLVDVMSASHAISAMAHRKLILHAGPPIEWTDMCGPVKGAIVGAILFEGWATTHEAAERLAADGAIDFEPCHHYQAVGPMAGIISPSMPLWVIENKTNGRRAFSNFNEGLGKVLRFGANNREVLERLHWMTQELAPALKAALKVLGEVELKPLMAQALHMGDEVHNRNAAATGLLIKRLIPALLSTGLPIERIQRVTEFIVGNDHFFLNLSMAACKAMTDAAHNVPFSSMITVMARNGVNPHVGHGRPMVPGASESGGRFVLPGLWRGRRRGRSRRQRDHRDGGCGRLRHGVVAGYCEVRGRHAGGRHQQQPSHAGHHAGR